MTDELRASPALLAVLSRDTLAVAKNRRDALRTLRSDALIPASAFGNINPAASASSAYEDVYEAAGTGVEGIADVLDRDADLVLRTAFAYQETDADEARKQAEACRCGTREPL
ncbi:hypothetical protein Afil01_09440 [Actinorhabdospora filicis]|uniref:Uncharacterized protein n=1 Tax=Actinorhabdospora filicis TaxID=1785913 RepID=A0A9W6SHN8_9ACTN|nr:hypothetical protein [Actinorhabdospora filicis]GLZ76137.1 hypothetical protein Afil01_09440 [Actinorhabdospora filicis]